MPPWSECLRARRRRRSSSRWIQLRRRHGQGVRVTNPSRPSQKEKIKNQKLQVPDVSLCPQTPFCPGRTSRELMYQEVGQISDSCKPSSHLRKIPPFLGTSRAKELQGQDYGKYPKKAGISVTEYPPHTTLNSVFFGWMNRIEQLASGQCIKGLSNAYEEGSPIVFRRDAG